MFDREPSDEVKDLASQIGCSGLRVGAAPPNDDVKFEREVPGLWECTLAERVLIWEALDQRQHFLEGIFGEGTSMDDPDLISGPWYVIRTANDRDHQSIIEALASA